MAQLGLDEAAGQDFARLMMFSAAAQSAAEDSDDDEAVRAAFEDIVGAVAALMRTRFDTLPDESRRRRAVANQIHDLWALRGSDKRLTAAIRRSVKRWR